MAWWTAVNAWFAELCEVDPAPPLPKTPPLDFAKAKVTCKKDSERQWVVTTELILSEPQKQILIEKEILHYTLYHEPDGKPVALENFILFRHGFYSSHNEIEARIVEKRVNQGIDALRLHIRQLGKPQPQLLLSPPEPEPIAQPKPAHYLQLSPPQQQSKSPPAPESPTPEARPVVATGLAAFRYVEHKITTGYKHEVYIHVIVTPEQLKVINSHWRRRDSFVFHTPRTEPVRLYEILRGWKKEYDMPHEAEIAVEYARSGIAQLCEQIIAWYEEDQKPPEPQSAATAPPLDLDRPNFEAMKHELLGADDEC